MNPLPRSKCCELGREFIIFDPDEDEWYLMIYDPVEDVPDEVFSDILFCPWCGTELGID